MNRWTHNLAYLCLIGLSLLISTKSALAENTILEEVQLHSTSTGIEIDIIFNAPMRYVTHSPATRGALLQIQLAPLSNSDSGEQFTAPKVLSWQSSPELPLRTLTYEGGAPGGPQLVLEFEREVEFLFSKTTDPLQLSITLPSITPTEMHAERPLPLVGRPVVERPAPNAARQEAGDISLPYAINLASSLTPITLKIPAERQDLDAYQLYQTRFVKDDKNWHRLRLGFFADLKSAQQVMLSLKKEFPQAWLTRTSVEERQAALSTVPSPSTTATATVAPLPEHLLTATRRSELLDQAEASMVAGDYSHAALLYTGLLNAADLETRQRAQEYLGLARDRANQLAHAKAEYEKYLELYPDSEGAARVRQRLNALLTARETPKAPLRKAQAKDQDTNWRHEAYGSVAQYYYHDSLTSDGDRSLAQSSLNSDFDFTSRSLSEKLDVRTSFVGGYENDFRAEGENDLRISSAYIDLAAHQPELSLRFGRQSRSTGGVLGRFDGGLFRWQISEQVATNLVGGFPVYSTRETSIDTDRPLYGISFDLGTFADRWDVNLFYINQDVDRMVDRRAIGGEVRYFEPGRSFFSLIDYDIRYKKLNTALFNGNLRLPHEISLTLSADYRLSPILTTSNALQGQSVSSIEALRSIYTEAEIEQLAKDRTAGSQTYTISLTRPLNQRLQISGDLSISRFGSTPASGGVEAMPASDTLYYASVQLVASDFLRPGDISSAGLRFTDSGTARTYGINLNSRLLLNQQLRLNPRLLVDYRHNTNHDGHRWRVRPAVRLEYRWKKRYHFELEGGTEWANEQLDGQSYRNRDDFFTLGYRVDF
jgi:hypothetical protein